MGMNTRGGGTSNKTYLGVYSNQLVLEYAKEEDLVKKLESLGYDPEKIQERKKAKGKNEGQSVYYFVVYDVEGMLTNITINENDWGDFVELEFTDVDEKFVVSLGDVFSRMSKDFIRRIGNLDLSEEINFGLWSMETDDGKKRSGVKMYQNDEKIEYFLSYDDMPEPTTTKKGRTVTWNYDEQEAYLYEQLTAFLSDNFKAPAPKEELPNEEDTPAAKAKKRTPRKPRAKATTDAKGIGSDEEEDDMPF
ncbi:MAG: hypothetical protein WBA57_04125 [Elainellaceae cyanobacterium]